MDRSLAVGSLSFLIALLGGPPLLAILHRWRIGKHIRDEGPSSHAVKEGTPTMGGLLVFLSVFVVTAPLNLIDRRSIALPLGTMVLSGILGAVDDLLSLTGRHREGMRARFKFLWMGLLAIVVAVILHVPSIQFLGIQLPGFGLSAANIPFFGRVEIGPFYLLVAIVTILGAANAVNLTDGLDTLAGGTAAIAFATYAIIAFLQQQAFLSTFCFTVVGGILGFLWYNAHPAQLFMGDTGSLALGSTLAVVSLMTGHWLLLPVVGIVFVLEAGSVLLQVAYFKLSGGRRLLLMSPLHHHLELLGWSETQVTTRFWLIGLFACMVGVALAISVP